MSSCATMLITIISQAHLQPKEKTCRVIKKKSLEQKAAGISGSKGLLMIGKLI